MDEKLLKETCETLTEIAEILYKGDVQTGIAAMNLVIPNLAVVATWVTDEAVNKRLVEEALTPALQAMEEQDGTMLADIITYELLDIFSTLKA